MNRRSCAQSLQNNNIASSILAATLFCSCVSSHSFASNVGVSYSQLPREVSLQNADVLLKPGGGGVYLALDLNDNWGIGLDYQAWQDERRVANATDLDLSLTSWGGSLSYARDNWFFSTNISVLDDELDIYAGQRQRRHSQEDSQTTSVGVILAYSRVQQQWMYEVSVGAQYSDWQIDTLSDPSAQATSQVPMHAQSKENTTALNASVTAAHFWPLTQDQGVLVGVMLSWTYRVSGDDSDLANRLPARPGGQGPNNRGGANNVNSLATDEDNAGQVSLYLSYDLSRDWSLDLDSTLDLSGENNEPSWSLGLGYSF